MRRRGGIVGKIFFWLFFLGFLGTLAAVMLLSSGSATASAERSNARARERMARMQMEVRNTAPTTPSAQDTARYAVYEDNAAKRTTWSPVSTFGLDVDTASYSNLRRFLNAGQLPPADAVRVEEVLNYFPPLKEEWRPGGLGNLPFRVGYEFAPCPSLHIRPV